MVSESGGVGVRAFQFWLPDRRVVCTAPTCQAAVGLLDVRRGSPRLLRLPTHLSPAHCLQEGPNQWPPHFLPNTEVLVLETG